MIPVYDCDNPGQRALLLSRVPDEPQVWRRKTVYGAAPGLIPFNEAFADKLVDPKDYKEVIAHCHEKQIFPIYHKRATWAPVGFRWNQNGLPYCWTWGGTAGLMGCEAREAKVVKLLSPVSMGWLVNWKNQGNYLESMIQGLKDRGVCEMSFTPDPWSRNPSTFKPGWEDNALLHRLAPNGVYDTDCSTTAKAIQSTVTMMSMGIPGPDALNWWSHALCLVSLEWDETLPNNLAFVRQNSHDEDDVIILTGEKAVPDELYGYASTLM